MGSSPLVGPHDDAFQRAFRICRLRRPERLTERSIDVRRQRRLRRAPRRVRGGAGPAARNPGRISLPAGHGAGLVGMSTVPEVIVAVRGRHARARPVGGDRHLPADSLQPVDIEEILAVAAIVRAEAAQNGSSACWPEESPGRAFSGYPRTGGDCLPPGRAASDGVSSGEALICADCGRGRSAVPDVPDVEANPACGVRLAALVTNGPLRPVAVRPSEPVLLNSSRAARRFRTQEFLWPAPRTAGTRMVNCR